MKQRRRSKKSLLLAIIGLAAVAVADDKKPESIPEYNVAAEATEAYDVAIQTLRTLAGSSNGYNSPSTPSTPWSSLLPNSRSPIASAIRIVYRIRQTIFPSPRGNQERLLWPWAGKDQVRGRVAKAIDLLEHAADLGNMDALYALAQISLFPFPSLPLNATRAFHAYNLHALKTGNSTSQAMVAFFYATGYQNVVEVDQSQALTYYTFAALGGDQGAEMVLGYRNWAGISTNENCNTALDWYESAASRSMSYFLSGPPGGRTLPRTATRLSDLEGGVYGPGASVASTGLNNLRPVIRAARKFGETPMNILEYYQYHADGGDIEATAALGRFYYQGSVHDAFGGAASGGEGFGFIRRDYRKAKYYFLKVARAVWPAVSKQEKGVNPHLIKRDSVDDVTAIIASTAAGYLGRMYLRGEGVKQDARVAKLWFERGLEFGDPECANGLGIIWRDGLAEKKVDEAKANGYFKQAAGLDLAEAQVNLGKYYYNNNDFATASQYFEIAIRHGSPFEAYYYLAIIHAAQTRHPSSHHSVSTGSCGIAVSFFKMVAERGRWESNLIGEAERLWLDPNSDERSREFARLRWAIAAERGFESAQNNLAFVLDQDKSNFRTRFIAAPVSNATARLALTQWTRSAAQRNVDALVKVGDYYYHGLGVADMPESLRWEKAAGYYLSAVDTQMSALAMWNLGWMYENGAGVVKDYHLAKRYYDMALETNPEAYIPIYLSLIRLQLKSFWHTFMGGTQKELTLWGDDDPDHWYLGKAKEDFKKRWRGRKGADDRSQTTNRLDGGDGDNTEGIQGHDPIEWMQKKKLEETRADDEMERGFGRDEYFGGAPARRMGEADEELMETMLLVALCIMISGLIYIRRRIVERRAAEDERLRREAVQVQHQGHEGNGNPLPVGPDLARADWAPF